MTKLPEEADHSLKYWFAACSMLDRAVCRLNSRRAQRAALIQLPTHACHTYMEHYGAPCVHKQHAHNHRGGHKGKRFAKRSWLLVHMRLRLCVLLLCILCAAPAVGQVLLKSSCPALCVGPSFLVRMIRCQIMAGNKTTNTYVHTPSRCSPCCVVRAVCCCLLYTSPSPRDKRQSRMPSSA